MWCMGWFNLFWNLLRIFLVWQKAILVRFHEFFLLKIKEKHYIWFEAKDEAITYVSLLITIMNFGYFAWILRNSPLMLRLCLVIHYTILKLQFIFYPFTQNSWYHHILQMATLPVSTVLLSFMVKVYHVISFVMYHLFHTFTPCSHNCVVFVKQS